MTETNMDFYLTGILANEKYFKSLPSDLQKILAAEIRKLAEEERSYSIKQASVAKVALMKAGVKFVPRSKKLTKELKNLEKEHRLLDDPEITDFYLKKSKK